MQVTFIWQFNYDFVCSQLVDACRPMSDYEMLVTAVAVNNLFCSYIDAKQNGRGISMVVINGKLFVTTDDMINW